MLQPRSIGLVAATASLFLSASLAAQNSTSLPSFDNVRNRQETSTRLEQARQRQGEIPALYSGEDEDVGPQSLLLARQRRVRWEVAADTQYFYTGNMFLQEDQPGNRPIPTGLLVNTAQTALWMTPRPTGLGNLGAGAGYRHQWFMYGLEESTPTLNAFDFNAGTAFLEGHLAWRDVWDLELGFDYVRLMSTASYAEFYKDFAPHVALTRTFPSSERSAWLANLEARYRVSDTDPRVGQPDRSINDRFEATLTVGYSRLLGTRLVLQPYWRGQSSHFTRTARNDFLSSVGLSATWFFRPSIALRVFSSYDAKDSDDPTIPDYDKVDAGGGFHLSVRF